MKTKLILFLMWFIIAHFSYAQNDLQKQADSCLIAGDLLGASESYKKLFDANPEDGEVAFNLARVYALRMYCENHAFKFLEIAIATDSTLKTLTNPDFYYLIDDPRWDSLEREVLKRAELKTGKVKKPELCLELLNMLLKDQAFYYHLHLAEEKMGNQSPVAVVMWKLKSEINTTLLERIEEIIAEHGWPKISDVGEKAASAAFYIIQHASHETMKKYLPILREAVEIGEAKSSQLALMTDRVLIGDGEKQIYGSQLRGAPDGTIVLQEIEDPEYVNQRRKSVGLAPIQEYIKNWGLEWTIEQKEK